MLPAGLAAPTVVRLADVRVAAAVMLAAAAVRPLVPGEPGISCPLRALTGLPCPLCGMTTSVTAAVHLQLGEAAAATPAGIVATVLAVALVVARRPQRVTLPAWLPPVVLALMWAYQLVRLSIV